MELNLVFYLVVFPIVEEELEEDEFVAVEQYIEDKYHIVVVGQVCPSLLAVTIVDARQQVYLRHKAGYGEYKNEDDREAVRHHYFQIEGDVLRFSGLVDIVYGQAVDREKDAGDRG